MAIEHDLWAKLKEMLRTRVSAAAMSSWFDECSAVELTDTELVLYTPSQFKAEIVEQKWGGRVCEVMRELLPGAMGLRVLSDETMPRYRETAHILTDDEEFTFDKFVVGSMNKYAHGAAIAVAAGAKAYNPLFIYGKSGLGKTHLLRAIRHFVTKAHPEYKIVYIKGDDFTNNLITSLQSGKMFDFRQKYRFADIFLMDDAQFIAGKESTQEEFFHTFNELLEAGHQVVLTSDRPPSEMARLDDRLRTRFESGLIADIQPPDFETRVAIVRNKAAALEFALPDDVARMLAESLTANVRQLEGAVKQMQAYSLISGMDNMSYPDVLRRIKDMVREKERAVTAEIILEETAVYFQLSAEELRGKSRVREIVRARQVAMYLIRTMTQLPLENIGDILGGRDHTTVMSGIRNVEAEQKTNETLRDNIKDLQTYIYGRANDVN
ncbi:MAG: chromosomal replication initiator protein DnaA [Oscillospiraceae bacterium]|jgi:chromosomal replication initiator protein|nr:chromosomal replication initiator protein DnaA [Oscillospiraceae bacterium]